jgi:hypothetical protein
MKQQLAFTLNCKEAIIMNANTFYTGVVPVLAIVATPDFKKQPDNRSLKKKKKKRTSFPSFEFIIENTDETIIYETTNCYGPNGKTVVKHASRFNQTM